MDRLTEAERFYLQHCLDMPGAIQIHLNAGDFPVSQPRLAYWTILSYQPRATIHDIVSHPKEVKLQRAAKCSRREPIGKQRSSFVVRAISFSID